MTSNIEEAISSNELEEGEIDDDEAEAEEGNILRICTRLAEDISPGPFISHSDSESQIGRIESGSSESIGNKHKNRTPCTHQKKRRASRSNSRPRKYAKFRNRVSVSPVGKSDKNTSKLMSRSSTIHGRNNLPSSSRYGRNRSRIKSVNSRKSETKRHDNRVSTADTSKRKIGAQATQSRMSEYSSRRQRLLSSMRKIPKSTTKPAARGHGASYDDLLTKYKEIKSMLRDLVSEEDAPPVPILDVFSDSDDVVEIKDVDKENIKSRKDLMCHSNDIDTQLQNRSKLGQSRLQQPSNKSNISSKDDEQEEEILRRIALASAQNARQKKIQYGSKILKAQSQVFEDNYEEVSMDLDSPPPSPICSRTDISEESKSVVTHEVTTLKNASSEIDEDEDILRAMLLSSLTNKQLEKSTQISETFLTNGKTRSQVQKRSLKLSSPKLKQAKTSPLVTHPPLHQPVVINLNEDSDSELELECSPSKRPLNIASIDDLLREARQKSDNKNGLDIGSDTQVPSSVSELPESQVMEYRRLKAQIAVKEQSKSAMNNASTASGNSSPVPMSECTNLMNSLKAQEQLLVKKRAKIIVEQTSAAELANQIQGKNEILSSAELKVKILQGQLNAAVKIVDAQKQALELLKKKQSDLQASLLSQMEETKILEEECLSAGKKIIGDSYGLPRSPIGEPVKTPVVNNTANVFKRKVGLNKATRNISITINNNRPLKSKPITRVSHEKAMLQEMEEQIAKKLQELRLKALRVSNKSKPVNKPKLQPIPKTAINEGLVVKHGKLPFNNGLSQRRERRVSHKAKSPSRIGHLVISKPASFPVQPGCSTACVAKMDECKDSLGPNSDANQTQVDFVNNSPMEILDISTFAFDFQNMFMNKTPSHTFNVKLPNFDNCDSNVPFCEAFRPYKSPLLHFKAYRFSPYFRTKANKCLSWPTYSHKVIPNKIFCRFDLTGTCNDDKCPWQHKKDYFMSDMDVLCDIVCYAPLLVGLAKSSSDQQYKECIENYLDKLLISSKDRMTHDQLCVLLVGRVNEFLGKVPPHYITFGDRIQRFVKEPTESNSTIDDADLKFRRKPMKVLRSCISNDVDPDAILDENDVRYFHGDRSSEDASEHAAISDPKNATMWLKLAYKNFNSIGCSQEMRLDLALNALSRGLEENQNNSEVWLHYLSLYSKRNNCRDLLQLCEQAIQFAPTYEIWWKYLQYSEAYEKKVSLCNKMMGFVIKSLVDPEVKSHQIIETLLYCTQLNVLTGRHPQAISVLEEALGKRTTSSLSDFLLVANQMTSTDKCLTWLCYIHLMEFHYLPSSIFNPGNSGLGKIVCKNLFILPWQTDRPMHLPVATILSLFMDALRNCVMKGKLAKVNVPVCLPLYKNLIALQIFRGRKNSAVDVCEQLMKMATLDEVWMLLACVHFKNENVDKVRETLHTALNGPNATLRLFCFAAMFEIGQDNYQAARSWACTSIGSLLKLPDEKAIAVLEPELIFSHFLGMPLPLNTSISQLKVEWPEIAKHKTYLWLTYCIFLITQGRYAEVKEAFETAIPKINSIDDLKVTWLHYLNFTLWSIGESVTEQRDFEAFTSLVFRCLSSVPCSVPLPGSSRVSPDYSFYNSVVELYAKSVDSDQIVKVYEKFVAMCPRNATLVLKLVSLYMRKADYKKASYFCQHHLDIIPSCLPLWKNAISLALGNMPTGEIRSLYIRATDALPYTISLWKDFMLFELANDEPDKVKGLIEKCQKLGIFFNDVPGNMQEHSLADRA